MKEEKKEEKNYVVERQFLSRVTIEEMVCNIVRSHVEE